MNNICSHCVDANRHLIIHVINAIKDNHFPHQLLLTAGLIVVNTVFGNLLPGDLGRGTHHQLPHPGHHQPGHHAAGHQHGRHSEVHDHVGSPDHQHHSEDHHHAEHTETDITRSGRQESSPTGGQVIDFSGAVEDPLTGLKCVVEEVAVETFDKEQLLTCTHSMIQVCDIFFGCFLSFRPLPPGLPLHVCDPVPPPPC